MQTETADLTIAKERSLEQDDDYKIVMVTTTARSPRKVRARRETRDATRLASPRSDLLGTSLTRTEYDQQYPRTNQTNRGIGMRPTDPDYETGVPPPTTKRSCLRLLGRRKAWAQPNGRNKIDRAELMLSDPAKSGVKL